MHVEFSNEMKRTRQRAPKASGLYGFLITYGLVKDREQATYVLIAIFFLCAVVTVMFWFGSERHDNAAPIKAEDSYRAGHPSEIDPNVR